MKQVCVQGLCTIYIGGIGALMGGGAVHCIYFIYAGHSPRRSIAQQDARMVYVQQLTTKSIHGTGMRNTLREDLKKFIFQIIYVYDLLFIYLIHDLN